VIIVLTNDDGIDAPGLAALLAATEGLGERLLVAPETEASGCSHAVTTHKPIRIDRRGADRVAVSGTPADCVRVALDYVAPEATWVMAGINAGGNLGTDIHHSGTVAAAREAVLHGRPAVAVSHYRKRGLEFDWAAAAAWVAPLLRSLTADLPPPGVFWNINLPHLEPGAPPPEVVFCRPDPAPLPLSFRCEGDSLHYNGVYQQRRRSPGFDVDICFGGKIAVSELRLF
jgi:5'-nucleotidase